jgi:hypothetical protein
MRTSYSFLETVEAFIRVARSAGMPHCDESKEGQQSRHTEEGWEDMLDIPMKLRRRRDLFPVRWR